jgi:ABC-type Mn2+/Zn2+ transport system permease subunit
VSTQDLLLTGALAILVIATLIILFKPFLVVSFDPILAATLRLPSNFYRSLLMVLLALTVVVSVQSVGVGLVAAMLVTPGATAYLLARRLPGMMVISGIIGAFSSLFGLFISYYLNIASGAAIVLTATILFILAYLFAPGKGILLRHSN